MSLKKLAVAAGILSIIGVGTLVNASSVNEPVVKEEAESVSSVASTPAQTGVEVKEEEKTSAETIKPVSSVEPQVISEGTSAK
ncbi:hypothetical protein [Vagococcus hydrophili]|uniref:Uncharacterized protein n=1 Tax=Vagococcus hydrophili TaxID=2714947 RepID=A0A6G8AV27_9ENTE|nr:hypothetical protein [Vagococcus hydrophili]QIL48840.1 hypothetical protein G7082_10135 [Vagococcus hydrophili]